ncbi:MAG: hypothetical protein R6V03_05925 [Kiritimatiellia bacterium]
MKAFKILFCAFFPAFCALIPAARAQEDASSSIPAGVRFDAALTLLEAADGARDAGNIEGAVGLYQKALTAYTELASEYPDWQTGMTKFRITYCRSQTRVLADEVSRREKAPPEPPPSMTAGELEKTFEESRQYLLGGREDKAIGLLLGAMAADPDNAKTRLLIGAAQCRAGNYGDAAGVLESLLQDDASNAFAHVTLGAAWFGLGRVGDALKQTELALELDPGLAEAHYNMAQLILALKEPDLEQAAEHYRKARSLGAEKDDRLETLLESGR